MSNQVKADIARDHALRRARKGPGVYVQSGDGMSMEKRSSASVVVYCRVCSCAVVDSARAKQQHYQRMRRCADGDGLSAPSK